MATKTYKPKRKISATESEEIKIPASSVDGLSTVATSGSYNDLSNKPTAIESVVDYGDTSKNIKIGYSGAGITGDNIKYIAGYTVSDGTTGNVARIKDISKDALKSWLGYATVATSGSYNDLSNKPTIPDVSGKANLSGGNTFTGKQTLNSPPSDGYSIDASGYVKGSWLQATQTSNKGAGTGKVCVFDGNGWIYYRTPAEILTEAGGVTQVKINGTTKSPDSAGLVDLGTISGGGSSNVVVDRPMIQGVEYTVFDDGEYGSFIGTFSLETQDSAITITVGNADYIITNNDWVHCKITIDKNNEFVYSTIAINTGNVNRTWFFSTLPSNGIVKISTDLTSSYSEHNVCVIMRG